MKFIVIGITDNPRPFFPPEVLEIIKKGRVFSGGKRHHEIVGSLLPEHAQWIDITAPLDAVFNQYSSLSAEGMAAADRFFSTLCLQRNSSLFTLHSSLSQIIVFASGDPLFFGFANTIRRRMPDAEVVVYPSFNSLQLLAHRLVMPYHDMRIVSLTGRPWPAFDKALIERAAKIGVLTDREHTPAAIARRMMAYGYTFYRMSVGEHLGNPELETVSTMTVEAAAQRDFDHPNCVILEVNSVNFRQFGIPDTEFALLDGRTKMITKMPIRLLTLQALDLPHRHVLWDIGACTGSVSIEARQLFPHLQVEAFEIRPECEAIICENARRHGVPGIGVHIGDFASTPPLEGWGTVAVPPDAVFIGGHGGQLKEIMAKVLTVLAPGGVIVMNSVTSPVVSRLTSRKSSRQLWDDACAELGLQQEPPLRINLNDNNPIEILKCSR